MIDGLTGTDLARLVEAGILTTDEVRCSLGFRARGDQSPSPSATTAEAEPGWAEQYVDLANEHAAHRAEAHLGRLAGRLSEILGLRPSVFGFLSYWLPGPGQPGSVGIKVYLTAEQVALLLRP